MKQGHTKWNGNNKKEKTHAHHDLAKLKSGLTMCTHWCADIRISYRVKTIWYITLPWMWSWYEYIRVCYRVRAVLAKMLCWMISLIEGEREKDSWGKGEIQNIFEKKHLNEYFSLIEGQKGSKGVKCCKMCANTWEKEGEKRVTELQGCIVNTIQCKLVFQHA